MSSRRATSSISSIARLARRSPFAPSGNRGFTTSPTSTPPPPTSRSSSTRTFLTLATGLALGSAIALAFPRPQLLTLLFPNPTPPPHPANSDEGQVETARLEQQLQSLPIVQQLRAATVTVPESNQSPAPNRTETSLTEMDDRTQVVPKYRESRPYASTPAGAHSLSGYTLRGPSKFAIPPIAFTTSDNSEAVFLMHLGRGLCGHEGVIHGGLLATVLDESLAWTALQSLPTNIGVTATLSLSYRKPTFADQFVVLRTKLTKQEGRKVWVKGHVEDLQGNVLVTAEALFVEPKMAKFLSNSSVREALK